MRVRTKCKCDEIKRFRRKNEYIFTLGSKIDAESIDASRIDEGNDEHNSGHY